MKKLVDRRVLGIISSHKCMFVDINLFLLVTKKKRKKKEKEQETYDEQ
jgi:hypothetical protein